MDIWAMEKGGRILYDVDPSQVGLNIFTSPLYQPYKQLVLLAKKIAETPKGLTVSVIRLKTVFQGMTSIREVQQETRNSSLGMVYNIKLKAD